MYRRKKNPLPHCEKRAHARQPVNYIFSRSQSIPSSRINTGTPHQDLKQQTEPTKEYSPPCATSFHFILYVHALKIEEKTYNFPSCILLSSAAARFSRSSSAPPLFSCLVSFCHSSFFFAPPPPTPCTVQYHLWLSSSLFSLATRITDFFFQRFPLILYNFLPIHTQNPTSIDFSASAKNAPDTQLRSLGSSGRNPTSASGNH